MNGAESADPTGIDGGNDKRRSLVVMGLDGIVTSKWKDRNDEAVEHFRGL